MKRRYFIGAATASVLIPMTVGSRSFQAFGAMPRPDDLAFFDERFEKARRIAASWAVSDRALAVQSDITSLWRGGLDAATRNRVMQLRGVTTEAFRFCLGVLVSEHASLNLSVSRIDRNLVAWTMQTHPYLILERRNG